MSNVEICQVAYEGRLSRLKALLEGNPKLISVADQVFILNIIGGSTFFFFVKAKFFFVKTKNLHKNTKYYCFLFFVLKKRQKTKRNKTKHKKTEKYYSCVFTCIFCFVWAEIFFSKNKKGTKKHWPRPYDIIYSGYSYLHLINHAFIFHVFRPR